MIVRCEGRYPFVDNRLIAVIVQNIMFFVFNKDDMQCSISDAHQFQTIIYHVRTLVPTKARAYCHNTF